MDASTPYTEVVFEQGELAVGRFVCPAESPMWREENRIERGPLFVVPRIGVEIEQVGHAPVITSAAHVMFYNRDQIYRRRLVEAEGDRCFFFRLPPSILGEMLEIHRVPRFDDPERPFREPWGPLAPRAFVAHRRVVARAFAQPERNDGLLEDVIDLLDAILVGLGRSHGTRPHKAPGPRAREAVYATQRYLVEHFFESDTLDELGRRVELSPYHLARAFRTLTGLSIHDYRERLRVLYALEHLDAFDRLVDLAFETGYSSHSHFTQAFRRVLGATPAALRGAR